MKLYIITFALITVLASGCAPKNTSEQVWQEAMPKKYTDYESMMIGISCDPLWSALYFYDAGKQQFLTRSEVKRAYGGAAQYVPTEDCAGKIELAELQGHLGIEKLDHATAIFALYIDYPFDTAGNRLDFFPRASKESIQRIGQMKLLDIPPVIHVKLPAYDGS